MKVDLSFIIAVFIGILSPTSAFIPQGLLSSFNNAVGGNQAGLLNGLQEAAGAGGEQLMSAFQNAASGAGGEGLMSALNNAGGMEGLTSLMGSLQGKRRKRTLDHDHIWEITDADLDENKDSSVEDVLWNLLKDDATERRRKHLARPDLRRLEKKRELQVCPQHDIAFRGNTIRKVQHIPSWEKCSSICHSSQDCYAWALFKSTCYLKNENYEQGRRPFKGVISGSKNCYPGTTERPSTYKRLGTTKRPSTYKRKISKKGICRRAGCSELIETMFAKGSRKNERNLTQDDTPTEVILTLTTNCWKLILNDGFVTSPKKAEMYYEMNYGNISSFNACVSREGCNAWNESCARLISFKELSASSRKACQEGGYGPFCKDSRVKK